MDERFIPAANAVELSEDDEIESSKFATAVKKIGGGVLITASVFSLASCGPDAEGTAPAKPEASVSATDSQDVDPKDAEFTPSESPSPTRSEASDLSTSSANETGIAKPSKTAEAIPDTTAKPSASTKPEATSSATEKEVDSYRFEVTKEEYDALMALSDKEFSALDIKERVKVAQYQASSVKYNAEEYYKITRDPNDRLPIEISENNTPQEALALLAAFYRNSYFIPDATNPNLSDTNAIMKSTAALSLAPDSYLMNSTKTRLADFEEVLKSGETAFTILMPDTAAVSNYLSAPTAINASPIFDGYNGYKTMIVDVEDGDDKNSRTLALMYVDGIWVEAPIPSLGNNPALVPVANR